MKFGLIDFILAELQVAFIVMKLCGAISWSWWLVMLPILYIVVLDALVFLLVACIKLHKSHLLIKQYGTDNELIIRSKKLQMEREKLERKMSQPTAAKQ